MDSLIASNLSEKGLALVEVPSWLSRPSAGHAPLVDWLPIITTVACLPTLDLMRRSSRMRYDLGLYTVGLLLAVAYHWAHAAPEGLQNTKLFGILGSSWRTLDILFANMVLGRMLTHAVDARNPLVAGMTSVGIPAAIVMRMLTAESLNLRGIARITVSFMLLMLILKAALEGFASFPRYPLRRGLRMLSFLALGFGAFYMPHLAPTMYWFYHSAWHVFMAVMYYDLYHFLLNEHEERRQAGLKIQQQQQQGNSTAEPVEAELLREDVQQQVQEGPVRARRWRLSGISFNQMTAGVAK